MIVIIISGIIIIIVVIIIYHYYYCLLLLLLTNVSILVSQVWHCLCPKETYIVPKGFILVPKALYIVPKVLYIVLRVLYIYICWHCKKILLQYMYAHLDSFIRRKDQSFCPPWEMKNSGCESKLMSPFLSGWKGIHYVQYTSTYIYSSPSLSLYICIHTHTHIYIHIHIRGCCGLFIL